MLFEQNKFLGKNTVLTALKEYKSAENKLIMKDSMTYKKYILGNSVIWTKGPGRFELVICGSQV